MLAACTTDTTQDVAVEAPDTIEVSFEENSRIQLSEGKTVWTQNDLVSVFYRSDANQQWKFQGNTGDRSGILKRVATPDATKTLSKIVAVYPYSENYYINPESCNIEAMLPAEQTYLKDSYGLDGNILVSASEFNQLYLRNVCGWLKIQLSGEGQVVEKITLKGNNDEQVAGLIYINSADATAILASEHSAGGEDGVGGTLVLDDTILTEVTLNCPNGVTLSYEPTAFYIALPPQTFEGGFTVVAECADGSLMTKSTKNEIVIARNTIQPMDALEYQLNVPYNQIWYSSADGNVITPTETDVFGANIVSNTYENGLGVITFDDEVTSIGERAFRLCSSLTHISIPDSVTSIGKSAFYNCDSLTSVTIPDSVTLIGNYAFSNCDSLATVTIPNSVTSIGKGAFYNCDSLTSVTIPSGVTEIGIEEFAGCESLTSITIPNSVTSIGNYAFSNCDSLATVTIPNSVTSIGDYAFRDCSSLTSVTIPDSVTTLGYNPFEQCFNLAEFNGKFASEDKRCLIKNGYLVSFAPAGVTEYTIPNSVTSIGYQAFYDCDSLTSVTIPDSVTEIGSDAFRYCSSLTSVTIPDSVTEIGSDAFRYCSSLTSVTIPDSVTEIGWYAFEDCSRLKSVYCKPATPPQGGSSMFSDNATGRKIYVPRASESAYEAAEYWSDYAADIEPYDFSE